MTSEVYIETFLKMNLIQVMELVNDEELAIQFFHNKRMCDTGHSISRPTFLSLYQSHFLTLEAEAVSETLETDSILTREDLNYTFTSI
jgi:hypothetical protein